MIYYIVMLLGIKYCRHLEDGSGHKVHYYWNVSFVFYARSYIPPFQSLVQRYLT